MSPQQLSKVYSVIGIFLLYFTIDTWSVTRGGQIIFGSKGVDPHRVHAAVNGIPIFSFLLCLISIVGIIYAGRSGIDAKWHSRVPILGFESMNTGSLEGKLYQAASLIGVSIVPAIGLLSLWIPLSMAPVITTSYHPHLLPSIWSWSALTNFGDPARVCNELKHTGESVSCDPSSITFLPGLEPTVLVVFTAIAIGSVLIHWTGLLRNRTNLTDNSSY